MFNPVRIWLIPATSTAGPALIMWLAGWKTFEVKGEGEQPESQWSEQVVSQMTSCSLLKCIGCHKALVKDSALCRESGVIWTKARGKSNPRYGSYSRTCVMYHRLGASAPSPLSRCLKMCVVCFSDWMESNVELSARAHCNGFSLTHSTFITRSNMDPNCFC